ncbi:histidine phosphatase family protein [bacterium]|nr:MAG: histidine phosphatase family protein [bacterium]
MILVRHGESAGNVARDVAHAAGHTHIDIQTRDADVPLSERGREQSLALGRWFAERPAAERPDVVLCSPYVRARQTAELVRSAGGLVADAPAPVIDERLREREFGILDRLTSAGIRSLFPEQAEFRSLLGKFYHRPPGGESWCDVILRLRGAVDTLSLHYPERRVLIVSHEVVVMCLRYLIEEMDEEQILTIDAQGDVANCAVTEYVYRDEERSKEGSLSLVRYNETAPLQQQGAPVTSAPDAQVAAK